MSLYKLGVSAKPGKFRLPGTLRAVEAVVEAADGCRKVVALDEAVAADGDAVDGVLQSLKEVLLTIGFMRGESK